MHAVLVAGGGSGHQSAQLLLTHTGCEVVCIDLSAPSLAFGELQAFTNISYECSFMNH